MPAAFASTVLWEPFFASTGQMNPTHWRQCSHAGRPSYGTELTASGTGVVEMPNAVAAVWRRRPDSVTGIGGIGYGRDRGVEPACGASDPQTPISYSAIV